MCNVILPWCFHLIWLSVWSIAGVLLEADWFESLENVGNESKNLPGVNVCSCLSAGMGQCWKNFLLDK